MLHKNEKAFDQEQLLSSDAGVANGQHKRFTRGLQAIGALLFLGTAFALSYGSGPLNGVEVSGIKHFRPWSRLQRRQEQACPQVDVLQPSKYADVWEAVSSDIGGNDDFRQQAVEWLSGAVRVKYASLTDTRGIAFSFLIIGPRLSMAWAHRLKTTLAGRPSSPSTSTSLKLSLFCGSPISS
jgi:hypothetical protein